jgi:hypothetical protein
LRHWDECKFFPELSFNKLSYKTEHLTFIGIFATLVIWLQITSCSRISLHLLDSFSIERLTVQLIHTYRAACLDRAITIYLSPLLTVLLYILLAEVRHCTMPHGYDVGLQLGFTLAINNARL